MFSSLGWGEILLLLIVALFIFGPDRLPGIARDAADALKKVRGFVTGAKAQIREELGDEFADLDLGSLNPREFVRRQLLDDDPPPFLRSSNGASRSGASSKPVSATMADRPKPVAKPAPKPASNSVPPAGPLSLTKDGAPRADDETPPYDPDAT